MQNGDVCVKYCLCLITPTKYLPHLLLYMGCNLWESVSIIYGMYQGYIEERDFDSFEDAQVQKLLYVWNIKSKTTTNS